jgi:hypothetical protein
MFGLEKGEKELYSQTQMDFPLPLSSPIFFFVLSFAT